MMHYVRMSTGLLIVSIITTAALSSWQEPGGQQDIRTFMRVKLNHTKEIVEGLSLEDFPKISKNAQDLAALSHDSQWNVMQTEDYLKASMEFRQSALRLRDNANEKNLDGATLAYFEVTLNCVRCHKYVRGN